MVKERVAEAHTSEGDREVGKALGKEERVSLHHIHSEKAIEAICREVISRVDGAAGLVHISPARLDSLRQAVKKRVMQSIITSPESEVSEIEKNAQNVKIREDWNSTKWKANAPHGWAWRQTISGKGKKGKPQKEVVALVYETQDHAGVHEIFLDRDILTHPRGALALIKNMHKRHNALMSWHKEKGEKSEK